MKLTFFSILVILIIACASPQKKDPININEIVFQAKDKEILEQVFDLFSNDTNTPVSALMVKVGTFFKETPYVAHTLESDKEQLIINLREMDCTTFAENCLAITNTIKSKEHTFNQFAAELQRIRYRNGEIESYPSRLHYFSEWISDNDKKKITKTVSGEIAQTPYENQVNFMSTHPGSYRQLKDNQELVSIISDQEKFISTQEMYYIPEDKITEFEDQLKDGDIVGITTSIKGLDISHVGILVRKEGRIHLMHASTSVNKVILSDETLEEYLLKSKSATGIMVARPL